MSDTRSATRYIIQIDRLGQTLDMPAVRALFKGTGIQIDESYGPILINPKLGRYVVRGTVAPEARAKAEQIPGVRFFADTQQKPLPR